MADDSSGAKVPERRGWTRKGFLIGAGALTVAAVGGRTVYAAKTSCPGHPEGGPQLGSLDAALVELKKLEASPSAHAGGAWSLNQILNHCAQSIEYSLTGYPTSKPVFIQRTVGRMVFTKFLEQGCMRHDLSAPIPDAPALVRDGDVKQGFARLEKAIRDFQQSTATPAHHFVYGPVTHAEYDRIHAMHFANHLSEIRV